MIRNNWRYSLVLTVSTMMLSSCGGGSSGSAGPTPPPPASTEPAAGTYVFQGQASAALADDGSEIWRSFAGALASTSGPVAYSDLRIDNTTFGITKSTKEEFIYGTISDIAGNAEFSIGRWRSGKVRQYNATGSSDTLIADNGITYVFTKTLPSFLQFGTMVCDRRLAATLPVIDFGSGTNPVLTGQVNVAFSPTGATISGSVQIKDDQYTYSFSPTSTPQLTAPNNTIILSSSSLSDQSMLLTLRGSNPNAPLAIMTYELRNATTFQSYKGQLVLGCH